MLLLTESVDKLSVKVLPCVSIAEINGPMLHACLAYWEVCAGAGVVGTMTGASREKVYYKEPLHMKGFAWDFRSYVFKYPAIAANRMAELLSEISPAYRVIYIHGSKPAHFHVEYRGT